MAYTIEQMLAREHRQLSLRGTLTYSDGHEEALAPEDIVEASFSEGVTDGLLLGAVLCSDAQLRLANADGQWSAGGARRGERDMAGAKITLMLTARADGETAETPFHTFFVKKASCPLRGAVTLCGGSGFPPLFAAQYADAVRYPASIGALVKTLVAAGGGTLKDETFSGAQRMVLRAPDFSRMTVRQALSVTLTAAGCFLTVDESGLCDVRPVWTDGAPTEIQSAQVISLEAPSPAFGPLAALSVETNAGEKRVLGDADAQKEAYLLTVSQNPLLEYADGEDALAEGLLAALKGLTLSSGRIVVRGGPYPLGTRLSVPDRLGARAVLPVTDRHLSFRCGALHTTVSCRASRPDTGLTLVGGTPAAGGSINGRSLIAGSVQGSALALGAVTTQYLSARAVTADKIAAGAVTADKLTAGAVTTDTLEAGSVTGDKLAARSVTSDKIEAHAVTADKLAASSVTADSLSAGAVRGGHISAGAITAESGILADACVGNAQIGDLSVTDGKIVSVSASKLTAGKIDAQDIAVVNLCADNITTGTLNGQIIPVLGEDKLAQGAVTGGKIAQGAVTGEALAVSSVTADKLAAGSVTSEKILSSAVTADKLSANAVTADSILAGSITADKLSADVGGALDLSANRTITAAVVDGAGVRIGQDGLTVGGARVRIETDSFSVSALKDGNPMFCMDEQGIRAQTVAADSILSPSVVSAGSGGYPFLGSIQATLRSLPSYLSGDVSVTVPAGTYAEDVVLSGFCGRGTLTLSMADGALLFGSIRFLQNACPVVLSGGVVAAAGSVCLSARDCQSLTVLGTRLFGSVRSSEESESRTVYGVDLSRSFALLSGAEISRTDVCVRVLNGALCRMENALGGVSDVYQGTAKGAGALVLRDQHVASGYETVATVEKGGSVTILTLDKVNGGYYMAEADGVIGYVSASYVSNIVQVPAGFRSAANLKYAFVADALSRIFCKGTYPYSGLGACADDAAGDILCADAEALKADSLVPVTPATRTRYTAACCFAQRSPLDASPVAGLAPRQGRYAAPVPAAASDGTSISVWQTISCTGLWVLDNAETIAGTAFETARLTVRRALDGFSAEKRTLHLYGHNMAWTAGESISQMPALIDLNVKTALSAGQEAVIDLPAEVVQMLTRQTIRGFALGETDGALLCMTDECTLDLA